MEDEILSALLDLRIAIEELQMVMTDIDQAARKLMTVQLDALVAKNTPTPLSSPEGQKGNSHE